MKPKKVRTQKSSAQKPMKQMRHPAVKEYSKTVPRGAMKSNTNYFRFGGNKQSIPF